MDKLKAAGLYGRELIAVSGSLARRYNGCLGMLGVEPTALDRFHIDGMGWSPEIAEEKSNPFYLNIGEANSNAIIISPNQEGNPVHMPFHSFDRDIMTTVFTAYAKEIRDITKDSAICIHLDQHMDTYYEPFDLLRYNQLTLSFRILNDLARKQKEQLELVEEFNSGNNFINRDIHNKLLDSARNFGDLRNRKLELEPLKLKIRSFYTKAFGGIFVLRDFINDIIIFESEEYFKKAIKDTVHDVTMFHIDHNELTATLVNHLIAEFNIKKAAKTKRYERIKNHLFVQELKECKHPWTEVLDSPMLFKRYLNELDVEAKKRLMSVERYNQRKIVERELKMDEVVDPIYMKALLEPHSSLEVEHKELIWKLLTKIVPVDPLHLYWYDKKHFYETYLTWPEGYQDWVIDRILKNNLNYAS
ncbi:hypothetical protein J1N09_10185 [Aureitalea sp. L0-47]|uniref:DUF6638 family protein n=1 Tax=Aureitalea sp. L0-47 TaxID=2816962 RepID=UPI002237C45C|nr:DUF6638 family protein [Aureitalea sp. L0-47]MCW5520207.1 hypothetical protein [Aureitalea sp. L0-47]